MAENMIFDMTSSDLAENLVGRKIVSVNTGTPSCTLDDGTVLEFVDTYDCCAWFESAITHIDLDDNAIMSVEVVQPEKSELPEEYSINILTVDKNVMALEIMGDPTSGYYCKSINLVVKTVD